MIVRFPNQRKQVKHTVNLHKARIASGHGTDSQQVAEPSSQEKLAEKPRYGLKLNVGN